MIAARLALTLLILLVGASPARADAQPGGPGEGGPPRGVPEVPAPQDDEARLTILPVPLPLVACYGLISYENFRLGPTRHDVSLVAGYWWNSLSVYDPANRAPAPPTGLTKTAMTADMWRATGNWMWWMTPRLGLGVEGIVRAGGLGTAATGGYDGDLAGGLSGLAGPRLQYRDLDELEWTRRGVQADLFVKAGHYWGTQGLDFQLGTASLARYFPLGGEQTLAVRGLVSGGWPYLAWTDKFVSGGGFFLRGYDWNRFAGDRMVSATVEYRNLFLPNIWPLVGLADWPAMGLGWTLHGDAGRSWESRMGIRFPSDLRYGGGTGLLLTIGRSPFGRLELNGSSEGFFPVATAGTSF